MRIGCKVIRSIKYIHKSKRKADEGRKAKKT